MKIINGLIIMFSITQLLSASEFKLDAGTATSIMLGDTLDLKGKVLSGDKSNIDHYQWEENGKVLKNTSDDEIIYWDDANAENTYLPKGKGNHILKFVVVDTAGKKHVKHLPVNVETRDNIKIDKIDKIDESDLKFDLRAEFNIINGDTIYIEKGDIIPLSGVVNASKKHLVDHYRWELNGKVLENQLHDEILYWDEENRENDYLPQTKEETLKFIVTDINGEEISKTLFLTVKDKNNENENSKDDYANTANKATKISLNTKIKGKLETINRVRDVDFFYFEVDKAIFIELDTHGMHSWGAEKAIRLGLNVLSEKLEEMPKLYRRNKSNVISRAIKLNPGKYYISLSAGTRSYEFSFTTRDAPAEDDVGDSMDDATEVILDNKPTKVTSRRDYNDDHDFFTFTLDQDQYVQIKSHDDRYTPTLYTSDSKRVYMARMIRGYASYITSHYAYPYVKLEAGRYYLDINSGKIGNDYSFDINLIDYIADEIGDTKETAKVISPNTTIISALNSRKDIDYFSIVYPKDGHVYLKRIKTDPLPGIDKPQYVDVRGIHNNMYVHKGKKVFFKVKHRTEYSRGYQPYKFELTFKEK